MDFLYMISFIVLGKLINNVSIYENNRGEFARADQTSLIAFLMGTSAGICFCNILDIL